jgi:hypothetical protein
MQFLCLENKKIKIKKIKDNELLFKGGQNVLHKNRIKGIGVGFFSKTSRKLRD